MAHNGLEPFIFIPPCVHCLHLRLGTHGHAPGGQVGVCVQRNGSDTYQKYRSLGYNMEVRWRGGGGVCVGGRETHCLSGVGYTTLHYTAVTCSFSIVMSSK